MFNLSKENTRTDADQLAHEASKTVDKVADQIKTSAAKVSEKIASRTDTTKDQADSLISSLRNLLDEHKQKTKVEQLKEQLTERAAELKHVVTDEVANAYATSKQRAAETVKENPVGTLVLAAGVGLLLGYVLGSKQSSQ
jgi:ElaB/YqjD/DUF883 family membrane-anchored ribosome-binding protein